MNSMEEQYGFDANFIGDVPDSLKCIVCHLVMRRPVQIMTCGHRFCKPCFERIQGYSKHLNTELCCPIDREAIDLYKVFDDTAVSRDIGNLQVACSDSARGCPWRGDLRNLQTHENECQHKSKDTSHDQVSGCKEEEGTLMKELLQRILKCENSLLEKEKEFAHMKYNIHELKTRVGQKEEELDLVKAMNVQLLNEVKDVKKVNEELKTQFEKDIQTLKTQNKIHENKINSLEMQVKQNRNGMQDEIKKTFNEIRSVRSHTDKSLNKKTDELMKLTTRMEAAEELIGDVDVKELSSHIDNIENVLFCHQPWMDNNEVQFKWTLTDYKHHFHKGERVWSPVFYPQLNRYCFKLSVGWTGTNKENFGLYLELSRGRNIYEDLTPFRIEYQLEILHKNGTKKTHQIPFSSLDKYKVDSFTILPNQQKPKLSGLGSNNMLTITELQNYIINDMMFISCTFKLV